MMMDNERLVKMALASGINVNHNQSGTYFLPGTHLDFANRIESAVAHEYETKIAAIDPLATLHFYKADSIGTLVAHGKRRHYRIKYDDIDNFYYIDVSGAGDKVGIRFDLEQFKTLEQAQAWCQADYDKYYKGLNDD